MQTEYPPKYQIEWGKLALIGVLIIGGFALIIIALFTKLADDRFAAVLALATGCITGPAGYLYGNGRLASRGEQTIPTIQIHPQRLTSRALQDQGLSSSVADAVAAKIFGEHP